ncbi:alpha/beta hydrolase [Niveibacterium sp.]|uniref:alpha/beta hydrolase n=1 Tax=Niveibacterium sp. TaxID=2017444 RepID=UPI0035B49D6B
MRPLRTPICLTLLTGLCISNAHADQSTLPDCATSTATPYLACLTTTAPMPGAPQYAAGGRMFRHGDTLDFHWRGAATAARVEGAHGSYGIALHRLTANDWAASVRVPNLAALDERFSFVATSAGGEEVHETMQFSGPDARARAPQRRPVKALTLTSQHLPQGRQVNVWLPPGHSASRRYPVIYIADGAAAFGDELLAAMQAGRLPAMVIVGIEADQAERFSEYVDFPQREGIPSDPARFAAHERFVVETVMPWAESHFGASTEPGSRIVAGFSNGADWAAAMALRHPDLFGRAIVMSPIMVSQYAIPDVPGARFDLSAGALEPPFARATACFAQRLNAKGAIVKLRWWPHTHATEQWLTAFLAALLDEPSAALPDAHACDVFREDSL